MNINATIIGQMITFAIFVWINAKFVWPKILAILTERENKILHGLQAAEQGEQYLIQAKQKAQETELATQKYCTELIAEAKQQIEQLLELSIIQAQQKSEEIINTTRTDLYKEQLKLQQNLHNHVAELVILGAEKIICSAIDPDQHQHILTEISKQIYGTEH